MPNVVTQCRPGAHPELAWDVVMDDPSLWTQEEYREYVTSRRPEYVAESNPLETTETALARMGVPRRYLGERIADWKPDNGSPRLRVNAWCAKWPPEKPFLTLEGDKGVGKTMLAVGTLRQALERFQVRGMFAIVPDLIDRYRRTQNPERATETADDIDDLLRRVPLLVLDDLGVGRQTEFAEERMYVVVNRRYNDMKPTIITTNVALLELEERIRSRVLSGEHVPFTGPDRRMSA